MILHAPGDRAVAADLGALHVGHLVGGEHGGAGRQRLDLVEMHGRRVEHLVLADVHRMLAAGLGQPDGAAEADLAALGILADAAAGGDRQHLQPPAASEHRRAGIEHGARQLDLPGHRRGVVIDVQARAGDGDAVVAFERLAVGQVGAGIAGKADVDDGAGQQLLEQLGVALARHRAAGRHVLGTGLRRISFHHEQSGRGHRDQFAGRCRHPLNIWVIGAEFRGGLR